MGTRIMNRDFDDILRAAAPPVPDKGPTRRANRAMLKPILKRKERLRRLSDRSFAVGVCVLALCLLVGSAGDLGSDDFESEMVPLSKGPEGILEGMKYYRFGLRGEGMVVPEGWTEAEARESLTQRNLEEGSLSSIEGWVMGSDESWSICFEQWVNGKRAIVPKKPQGKEGMGSRRFAECLFKHLEEFKATIASVPGPASRVEMVEINGVLLPFQTWTIIYPDYGPLTYYLWTPTR